ncbi:hypothetical protein [Microvirga aerophila]|nr:hypothetical protein [Microvirga aerophila]
MNRMNDLRMWRGLLYMGRGLIVVGVAWLLLVVLLLGLQESGQNFGFNVWWSGEARTWMVWLQEGPGSLAARIFWQIDGRNPLSPWWYISVRSLILSYPAAFLVLHLAASLLLGLACYLTVISVTRGRGRLFGISLGILTAVFLCSTRTDNVHWLLLGALACSLLSVACFAQFLNSGRRPMWLAWSLILWTVAFQTYTIQSGAVLAVGVLSFLQEGQPYSVRNVVRRVSGAGVDVLPYVVTLLLFVLVWRTTSTTGVTETISLSDPSRIVQSLKQGLWHSDYSVYLAWARQLRPELALLVLMFVVPLLLITQGWVGGVSEHDDAPIGLLDLTKVLLVGVCLVVPTVALESTSPMHPPGSRWIMVIQFWAPLLALSLVALAVLSLPLSRGLKHWTWWLASASLATGAILLTLAFNQIQTDIARDEQAFMAELRRIVIEDRTAQAEFPRHYLIKSSSRLWLPSEFVNRAYTRTQIGSYGETTFRYLTPGPTVYPPVFLPDGVKNPEAGRQGFAPYSRVGVLAWDGKRMERVSGAD